MHRWGMRVTSRLNRRRVASLLVGCGTGMLALLPARGPEAAATAFGTQANLGPRADAGFSVAALPVDGKGKPCFARDAASARVVAALLAAPAAERPGTHPTWRLTCWQDGRPHLLEAWPAAGVAAIHSEEGKVRCVSYPGLRPWLHSLPPAMPVPARPLSPKVPQGENCGGPPLSVNGADSLDGSSEYVSYGRMVGLVDNYFQEPEKRRYQTSVYLFQVHTLVKTQRNRRIQFLKIQWPGGYLEGGEEYPEVPLPRMGEEYLLYTSPQPRIITIGKERVEFPAGDHAPSWSPYTVVKVVNGKSAPLNPRITPDHWDLYRFWYPQVVPIFDQPVEPFLAFIRWGLRDENRGIQHKPMPGPAGRALRPYDPSRGW